MKFLEAINSTSSPLSSLKEFAVMNSTDLKLAVNLHDIEGNPSLVQRKVRSSFMKSCSMGSGSGVTPPVSRLLDLHLTGSNSFLRPCLWLAYALLSAFLVSF